MARENPNWGYTRIQGALKNMGHRVARSTIATILKDEGLPPCGERPTSWRTCVRAHWPALVAADFFTTVIDALATALDARHQPGVAGERRTAGEASRVADFGAQRQPHDGPDAGDRRQRTRDRVTRRVRLHL